MRRQKACCHVVSSAYFGRSFERESTQDLRRYIEKLPCRVPSEILELFRDDAESAEARRVLAVQTQAVASTGSDIRPRRRLRGKQAGPSVAVFQAANHSEVKPSVPISSTPTYAGKRHLHAAMAEDRAAKSLKRGIGSLNLVERNRRRSEFNSAIDVANTPAGARARRYANTVKKRVLDAGAIERLKSGKFVETFLKANAARRRADAVVLESQPGSVSDISIPSVSSGISDSMSAVPPSSNGSHLPQSLVDSTTFVCLREDEDCKPRGLFNMLSIGYGGGSCWISAGLQFLFGSERLQVCLRHHFNTHRDRFCRRSSVASQSPWMVAHDEGSLIDTSRRISRRVAADSQINCFDGLSLTYLAMLQGRDSMGSFLKGRKYVPHIQLDRHYSGQMQDAIEFALAQITDPSSRFDRSLFTGLYSAEVLQCSGCGRLRPTHSAEIVESRLFTSIPLVPLPSCTASTDSMQAAVDRLSEPDPLDETYTDWSCSGCSSSRPPIKYRGIESSPELLILTLSRMVPSLSDTIVLQQVTPFVEPIIVVCGHEYGLKSILYHMGVSPQSGHYIAVVRHGASAEDYWFYDDLQSRRRASENERTGQVNGYKVYAVMYER